MLNDDIKNLPGELWKPIDGFESIYWVSNKGRVCNNRKVMLTYRNNSGYLCIDFTVNRQKTKNLVHRLVAKHFCSNPKDYPEVNHIDENKDNNADENLEWCTRSHNKQHSMATGTYDKIYTQKNTLGKKHKKNTASKYHNVSYDRRRDRWVAVVIHEKKKYGFKRFHTEEEAALHVNSILDTYGFTDRPKNII